MILRSDGRKYKQVTRRSVAIAKRLPTDFTEHAKVRRKLHKAKIAELYLSRYKKNISESRLLAYLQLHSSLVVAELSGDKVRLHPDFIVPTTERQWINALADQASMFLGEVLKGAGELSARLAAESATLYSSGDAPTPRRLAESLIKGEDRDKELFRWALYLYLDGDGCPLQIRRRDLVERTTKG